MKHHKHIIFFIITISTLLLLTHSKPSSKLKPSKSKPPSHPHSHINSPLHSTPFDISQCEMITDGPMCMNNGNRMLLPNARPDGLQFHFNFDETKPIDTSGNHNHAEGIITAGTAFGGYGASALFTNSNNDYITVQHKPTFNSNDFSYTFLLYIHSSHSIQDTQPYITLLYKGNNNNSTATPCIKYNTHTHRLQITFLTYHINSIAKLNPHKWFHIALIKHGKSMQLYVNGIKDVTLRTVSEFEYNEDTLYIGGTPFNENSLREFSFLLDELKYYTLALSEDYVQAEASPVLGGIEPSFIQVGCLKCSVHEAKDACDEEKGYRLCTSIELHVAGYQVARTLGLISDGNMQIWTHNVWLNEAEAYNGVNGLGLCCSVLK